MNIRTLGIVAGALTFALACAQQDDPHAVTPLDAAESATADANDKAQSDAPGSLVDAAFDTASADSAVTGPQDTAAPQEDSNAAADAGQTPPKPQITALDAPSGKGLPSFSAVKDTTGKLASASTLQGQWTVLWFYPAASTFG